MKLRLACSVITAIEPDILLLDEVIGVGDASFKAKAKTRLRQLIGRSSILVISSHSMGMIKQFCNKVLVLDRGQKIFLGDVHEGIDLYKSMSKS